MPIIEMPSPLGAASDAAQTYAQGRDLALTRAMEKEQFETDTQLKKQQMALESRQADEQQKVDEADIASRNLHDQIDKDAADFEKSIRPFTIKLMQAQIQGANDQHSMAVLQKAEEQFEFKIRQKYGPQEAQLAVRAAQQQIAESVARIGQGWANIGIERQRLGQEGGIENRRLNMEQERLDLLKKFGGMTPYQAFEVEQKKHTAGQVQESEPQLITEGQTIIDYARSQNISDAQIMTELRKQKYPPNVERNLILYMTKPKKEDQTFNMGKPAQMLAPVGNFVQSILNDTGGEP